MSLQEYYYPSVDGVHQCHVAEWAPDGEIKGVIQLAHGINEFILRYDRLGNFFAENGYVLVGNDHLGHGGTARKNTFGYFAAEDGWNKVAADVYGLHEILAEKYPNAPHILYGHSMGSFLARTCLIQHPGEWNCAVLSGTGYTPNLITGLGILVGKLEMKRLGKRGVSNLMKQMAFGSYNKKISDAKSPNAWLSRDEHVVEEYDAEPLTNLKITASLYVDMMTGLRYIIDAENLKKMDKKTPVFMFSGEMDPVGGYGKGVKKVFDLFKSNGCEDVTIKLYPDGRHEMHNELNYEEVYNDILNWINSKI